MNLHERVRAIVSEQSGDYLLVTRIGDQTVVCASRSDFANLVLGSDHVRERVDDMAAKEDLEEPRQEERRHHGAGQDGPRPEAPATKEEAEG